MSSGNGDEMEQIERLRDDEIDRLVDGRIPGGAALDDLAAFASAMRDELITAPDAAIECSHLAKISETLRDEGTGLVPASVGSPKRRSAMLSTIVGSLAAKVAAAAVAVLAAGSGLAATGNLPAAAQEAVASAADRIGLSLPDADEDEAAEEAEESDDDAGAFESDDDQAENVDSDDDADADDSDEVDETESVDLDDAEERDNHGAVVSETARTTDASGRDKGKEVSSVASSKSQEHRNDERARGGDRDDDPGSYDSDE